MIPANDITPVYLMLRLVYVNNIFLYALYVNNASNVKPVRTTKLTGELIVSRYVAESITTDERRFGHVGLCQLRTKLKIQQCD